MVSSSKFYLKSLTLTVSILEMINLGLYAAQIARRMDMKKSHISYYIKKLKHLGYVKETVRDVHLFLELTQAGKNYLDQYKKKTKSSLPICRAENIRFKAQVIRMRTIPVDWKRIQMHNWVQWYSKIDNVFVKLNAGSSPTVELLPSLVEGDDPWEIYLIYIYECHNVLYQLFNKIGLEVGKLKIGSRGEWLAYDPIAKNFCNYNGQVSYEGIAKVNASKPRHIGELEFHDPRALQDYLLMPKRLKNLEAMFEQLLERVNNSTMVTTNHE